MCFMVFLEFWKCLKMCFEWLQNPPLKKIHKTLIFSLWGKQWSRENGLFFGSFSNLLWGGAADNLVEDFRDNNFAFRNSMDLDLWSLFLLGWLWILSPLAFIIDLWSRSGLCKDRESRIPPPCDIGDPRGSGLSSRVKWSKSPRDRLWWKLSARRIMAKGLGLFDLVPRPPPPWWFPPTNKKV